MNSTDTFSCLQCGDNDLIGNKFNGHDLHFFLNDRGIETVHLVQNKESDDPNTFLYPAGEDNFTLNLLKSPHFLNADIVHLHLMHNTPFDLMYLPLMSRLKPVVITLHDPFYLAGHCIHQFNCNKWQTHCEDCPKLDAPFPINTDDSALRFRLIRDAIQNSNITGIVASGWMKNKVSCSPIWAGKRIEEIPFGLCETFFHKENQETIKAQLKIPAKNKVLFFRTQLHFKGLSVLHNVLKRLVNSSRITLLTVGDNGLLDEFKTQYDLREYGWLKNDEDLAKLYQASDLFLMPSEQEAFGMMAIEAMFCGKLVLVTPGTSLEKVIDAPNSGCCATQETFPDTVKFYLDHAEERMIRAEKCYAFAQKTYQKDIYIDRLTALYRSVIDSFSMSDDDAMLLKQLKKHALDARQENTSPSYGRHGISHPEKKYPDTLSKRRSYADNRLWRIAYRILLRPGLILMYGKSYVRQKYDIRFL